jgi:integrase
MVKDTIRCMSLYKDGKYWYYSLVNAEGVRERKSTHQTDKREAQKIHDRLRFLYDQGKANGFTLADALREWLTDKERPEREKSAVRILLEAYPSRPLKDVLPHEIVKALKPRAESTINRTLNIIRAAINLSASRGLCEPIKIERRDEPPTDIRFLRPAEWDELQKHLPEHALQIVKFALATGLRHENVVSLQWRSVDIENKTAWVNAIDAKGRKVIPVPLGTEALSILEARKDKHDTFVFTYGDKPIKSIKTTWKRALVKANIYVVEDEDGNKKSLFRFHDLRHTWASWKVQKGTPLKVVQELGGWSSLELVMRYAHLDPDHLREWVD